MSGVEQATNDLARKLARASTGDGSSVFRLSWVTDRILDQAMERPAFRARLFQLVDVLPATTDADDVHDHVLEYLNGRQAPGILRAAMAVSDRVPFGPSIAERVATANVERMAQQFIAGTTADEAVGAMDALWGTGRAHTMDLLGEKTIVPSEGDRYRDRVLELMGALAAAAGDWPAQPHLERDDRGGIPRVNVSIKPTALATHYEPLGRDRGLHGARERIRPILRQALADDVFVYFDMEHYDVKDLTLQLFRELLGEDEFAAVRAGVVIQTYLRDSRDDLADLIAWSGQRAVPVGVRLVKGAYWDTESIHARAEGWPVPVFEDKDRTDANFERCVRLAHDHHGDIDVAVGSHNLRSVSYSVAYARAAGIPDAGHEIQMLLGMAEPMHRALVDEGIRLRVYCPVGELVPGMAYLVRRLLENTSNTSFVRLRHEGADLDALLRRPAGTPIPGPTEAVERHRTDPDDPADHAPEPVREWRRATSRARFAAAIETAAAASTIEVPALIAGRPVETTETIDSPDPADPDRIVARSSACTAVHAGTAVEAAVAAAEQWRRTPARERARVLFDAAHDLRGRRDEISALEVFEAGKPWDQADADLCEAIDFCEYYGRQILRYDRGAVVQSPPGEINTMGYRGRGVTAVIGPWNFPLAIPTGMTVASLVAGNPTILKPAEQTPATAWEIVRALRDAGAPDGVIQFLPGRGEDVGAALVEHPQVATIAFTGSRDVGLRINEVAARVRPGQRFVTRVIAEMGGKNALYIDGDADPDQAIPGAVYSAFGFAGQKCSAASRLLVHESIYDDILQRLAEAVDDLVVGHPREPGVLVGPLIDAEAQAKTLRYIAAGERDGRIVAQHRDVPSTGWFAPPTVVADLADDAALMCEEVFGPVLAVRRVRDLDEAIRLANATDYALTAGIYTRTPSHSERFASQVEAGNVYVNKPTTGAVVGRQPFGGYRLSGVGSKAGSPDYLLQFQVPVAVSENIVRQGFAPD